MSAEGLKLALATKKCIPYNIINATVSLFRFHATDQHKILRTRNVVKVPEKNIVYFHPERMRSSKRAQKLEFISNFKVASSLNIHYLRQYL